MTNLSKKTRKQLVLEYLKEHNWVRTAELENERVGGTQGTRRVRELRAEGWSIEREPDPNSAQWRYRLVHPIALDHGPLVGRWEHDHYHEQTGFWE